MTWYDKWQWIGTAGIANGARATVQPRAYCAICPSLTKRDSGKHLPNAKLECRAAQLNGQIKPVISVVEITIELPDHLSGKRSSRGSPLDI